MEQIDKIAVIWLALEVESEEVENGSFEHEGVVDRYHADFGQAVPAWLRTAGDRRIHDVVCNEEEGL